MHTNGLAHRINNSFRTNTNLLLRGNLDQHVEGVVPTNAIFVPLPLHSTPARFAAASRHRLVIADTGKRFANDGDTTDPSELATDPTEFFQDIRTVLVPIP